MNTRHCFSVVLSNVQSVQEGVLQLPSYSIMAVHAGCTGQAIWKCEAASVATLLLWLGASNAASAAHLHFAQCLSGWLNLH